LKPKLLVDENLSPKTVQFLRSKGFDVLSIGEDHEGFSDAEIAGIAKEQGRVILTFDLDFGEIFFLHGGSIVVLKTRSKKPRWINQVLEKLFRKTEADGIDPLGKLIVVSENRIRVRE